MEMRSIFTLTASLTVQRPDDRPITFNRRGEFELLQDAKDAALKLDEQATSLHSLGCSAGEGLENCWKQDDFGIWTATAGIGYYRIYPDTLNFIAGWG